MKVEQKKLTELIPRADNIRMHNDAQINEIAKSVKMFGQIRPIVIDEQNKIIAGHGLLQALKSIGEEKASVYIAKGLSEAQKKKLMLADNKVYEMGFTNYDLLTDLLNDIVKLGDDLVIPGYDDEMLTMLVSDFNDIDDKINNLGKIEKEIVNNFNSNNYKNEQKVVELNNNRIQLETSKNEPPRPYVVCDHCGEKVWL